MLNKKSSINVSEFDVISPKHKTQEDSYNCGVYVCFYAKQITEKKSIEVAFDETKFREHILSKITGNCLQNFKNGFENLDICKKCQIKIERAAVICKRCKQCYHDSCVKVKTVADFYC